MLAAFSPLKPVRVVLLEETPQSWGRRMRRAISNDPEGQFIIRCLKWAAETFGFWHAGLHARDAESSSCFLRWCPRGEQLPAGVLALQSPVPRAVSWSCCACGKAEARGNRGLAGLQPSSALWSSIRAALPPAIVSAIGGTCREGL